MPHASPPRATIPLPLDALSVEERLRLIEQVWESLAADPDTVAVPEWQQQELKRRVAEQANNPQPGSSWNEVEQRIRGRHG